MPNYFYLLIDANFSSSYLISMWLRLFNTNNQFKGILLRECKPSEEILDLRAEFHCRYVGQSILTKKITNDLNHAYGEIDQAEAAMISLFGIPEHPSSPHRDDLVFLGKDINGEMARDWFNKNTLASPPFFFSQLDQIIDPWWIDISNRRILNVHSAILPYARGVHSIENIAVTQDLDRFKEAAGTTVHYIDEGIDTGPIIRAERVNNPFRFHSIWELKGYIYMLGYRLYTDVAKHIAFQEDSIPAGVVSNPNFMSPNYRKKDFTPGTAILAENGYLAMKSKVGDQ